MALNDEWTTAMASASIHPNLKRIDFYGWLYSLTIHFEEYDFAHARTNGVFGLAQKVSLRFFCDLLKEYGAVGKRLYGGFIDEVLVFTWRGTNGLLPRYRWLGISGGLTMQMDIVARLSTRVFRLQYPFWWYING